MNFTTAPLLEGAVDSTLNGNVEKILDQDEDAASEHLDTDQADQHSAETFYGNEPFFAKELLDEGAEEQNDERRNPGANGGQGYLRRVSGLVGVKHDGSDDAGACHYGNRQRDNHWLGSRNIAVFVFNSFWKDHRQ